MAAGKPINIRIDPNLRSALEEEAQRTNRTLSGLIKHILIQHVEDSDKDLR